MLPLNPIDAIAPAFTRTHEILFRPFRLGRSWKLAVCQYLGLLGGPFVPFPLFLALGPVDGPPLARVAVFIVLGLATLIFFVFFYLGARMQFVNFEMVVTRAQFIAPMWRRYGTRVWPVIGFKVVLGTVLSLLTLPLLLRSFRIMFATFAAMPRLTPGEPPDPQLFAAMFSHLAGFYALIFCAFIFLKLFSTAFEDFALPFYLLEDISLPAALRRGVQVFAADPLQCILYLILKLILSVIGFILQYVGNLIVLIPVVIVGLVAGAVGVGITAALHGTGPAGKLLLAAAAALLYLAFLAAMLWYQTGTLGYLATLLEAYATYFLAGRYPLLASLLEPGPGAPFTPPPPQPSPEELDDDDSGPPMPMDPAIA